MSSPSSAPPIIKDSATQKLVTIYLDNSSYIKGEFLVGSFAKHHGLVEEHLGSWLSQGWRIVSVSGFGGNSEGLSVRGWVIVLLEKSAAPESKS